MRAAEGLEDQIILILSKLLCEADKCTKAMIMVLQSGRKYLYLDMVELMLLMMLIKLFTS